MLTPVQFKQRWIAATPNPFRQFETHEVEILNLPPVDKIFLAEAGLPNFASPYLYFGEEELPTIEGTPYIQLGSCGDDRPICVDSTGSGRLVWLVKEGSTKPYWFSTSIPVLCETLLAYQDMEEEAVSLNGRRAARDNNIPDFLVYQFQTKLREVDPEAVHGEESFWNKQIQWATEPCDQAVPCLVRRS